MELEGATIRSKYYLNYIMNRTRVSQELFDRPSYVYEHMLVRQVATDDMVTLLHSQTCDAHLITIYEFKLQILA